MKAQGAAESATRGRAVPSGRASLTLVRAAARSTVSREYARLFGSAPTRNVARLRQDGILADEGARG
jgi:hypothetical protein